MLSQVAISVLISGHQPAADVRAANDKTGGTDAHSTTRRSGHQCANLLRGKGFARDLRRRASASMSLGAPFKLNAMFELQRTRIVWRASRAGSRSVLPESGHSQSPVESASCAWLMVLYICFFRRSCDAAIHTHTQCVCTASASKGLRLRRFSSDATPPLSGPARARADSYILRSASI